MKHVAARPGWAINLHVGRWHRVDNTKKPEGQVSFCGVGICTLELLVAAPYFKPQGRLYDLLTGKRDDAPTCKKCAS